MSIVLPRRKKKTDIFAPRKSVQDAKEKLGPAFFDPSLLECSRNAVELNKLVNKWDDIDKQKVKVTRDLTREQNALARAFKRNYSVSDLSTRAKSSEECLETLDGKLIPPGFRFKSNGELKMSTTSLPHVHLSTSDENSNIQSTELKLTSKTSLKSTNQSNEDVSSYNTINYNKEIKILRDVIVDICEELSKSKISMSKSNSGKLNTFLRAHSNEYISVSDYTGYLYEKPNDRFAFQPGSSEKRDLYKQTIKTPSTRACAGCQFKLKQQNDELQKLKMKTEYDMLRRRWSYVPAGKYVSSSTSLVSSTHLLNSPSLQIANINSSITNNKVDPKPTSIQSKVDSEINPRKAVSFQLKQREHSKTEGRTKSSPCVRLRVPSAGEKKKNEPRKPTSALARYTNQGSARQLESSLSCRSTLRSGSSATSGRGTSASGLEISLSRMDSRHSARLLADFDSRLNLLKEFQAEEAKQCETKVKKFLENIDSKH